MAKKYDPLWEIVGEKVPLQGVEPDVDALCPNCHVRLHLGLEAKPGDTMDCGLCGAALTVIAEGDRLDLELED